jgi:hypothetical protein
VGEGVEETRRTAASPTGGDRRSVLKPHRDWLLGLRRKENDLTLDAIAERLLRTHGVEADKSMLSRFFAAEGISFKKTVRASEQDRPDVAERRKAWRSAQKSLGGRLIFLDETWTTTAMTRRYAWAAVGARAFGHAPNGHWKTTTFLAGEMPNSRHRAAIGSSFRSLAMNFSRSSMGLHAFQGILRSPQKAQLCNPCLRNEPSPLSEEEHSPKSLA